MAAHSWTIYRCPSATKMNKTSSTSMHVGKMTTTLNKEGTSHADQGGGVDQASHQVWTRRPIGLPLGWCGPGVSPFSTSHTRDFGCSDIHSRRGAHLLSVDASDSAVADKGFKYLKE
ncbi:hypothetical protein PRIPAC_83396, partial [Pristionchus pacificus]|uniref:Uncharacterized protein n=1 Tax=Pristionchus pacificus TaxID=54126 RepID=A0A2A6BLD4_PRIPA